MADTPPQTQANNEVRSEAAEGSQQAPMSGVAVGGSGQPNKTLYVTDLAPSVTESTLLEVFRNGLKLPQNSNAIQSIRVCRDSNTHQSLGYAYVNFHRAEDCDKALDLLNFELIGDKACRISKSIRDPSIRRSGVGNLFVKNLAKDIDHAGLYDVFCMFGEIISCKVATDKFTGESKGYGFVHFANVQDAEKAIEKLNGKCFNDKKVYVGKFIPRAQRSNTGDAQWTNIYVKNLNKNVNTQEKFKELLTKATADLGNITSPKLMVKISNENGTEVEVSKGFGFVNFESHEVAKKALERFQDEAKMRELVPELLPEGETFYSNVAMTKQQRKDSIQQDKNLYVKNIADTVTDEQFKELFEYGPEGKKGDSGEKHFGAITSAVIMKDERANVPHRGFGFVCYETKEAAIKALQEMNGYRLENKPLYVAIAQPRELRKKQLAQQFASLPRMPHAMPVGYPNMPYFMNPPRFAAQPQGRAGQPPFAGPTRGRVGGFAAGPPRIPPVGARGPGPQSFIPAQVARAPPQPESVPFLVELVSSLDMTQVTQKSAEMLETAFAKDNIDTFVIKRCVGKILTDHQNKPSHQLLECISRLYSDANARNAVVQSLTHSGNQ